MQRKKLRKTLQRSSAVHTMHVLTTVRTRVTAAQNHQQFGDGAMQWRQKCNPR